MGNKRKPGNLRGDVAQLAEIAAGAEEDAEDHRQVRLVEEGVSRRRALLHQQLLHLLCKRRTKQAK